MNKNEDKEDMQKKELNEMVAHEVLSRIIMMIIAYLTCRILFQFENTNNIICNVFFLIIYTLINLYMYEKDMHKLYKEDYIELDNIVTKMLKNIEDDLDNAIERRKRGTNNEEK